MKERSTPPDRYAVSLINPSARIEYTLPVHTRVTLVVYDVRGSEVEKLVDQEQPPEVHNVVWNADNVASGVFFYRLQTTTFVQSNKTYAVR
ncbi:MAG TPA: hypothetical protein VFG32_09265 [Bacteroidota bacterium]|nr:hypothetical protein [Bacteroidota bacterium]